MSDNIQLPAEPRERAGKGSARAARRAGRVPGVIYGAKKDPALVTLESKELVRQLNRTGFFATLIDLQIGKGKESVLARDVQFDPVTDLPTHVDFLRVSATTKVTVQVPVVFLNEDASPGLVGGGVLNVVRYEVEVSCRADAIPSQIDIDLSGLEVGDGVHISMVSLPDGVEPTITDRDFTIATIAAPVIHVEPVDEDEEGLESEDLPEGAEGEEGEGESAAEEGGEAKEE